jgi:hypothetical protein
MGSNRKDGEGEGTVITYVIGEELQRKKERKKERNK